MLMGGVGVVHLLTSGGGVWVVHLLTSGGGVGCSFIN